MEDNFEEEQRQYRLEQEKELKTYLDKIEHGEKTTENYLAVFSCYKYMPEKNKYKAEIEKYAKLTEESAKYDIAHNNKVSNAYLSLSYIFRHYKQYDNAFLSINKAIELAPDATDLYLVRADLYKECKQPSKAELDYEKVLELDPEMQETVDIIRNAGNLIGDANKTIFAMYAIIIAAVLFCIYQIWDIIKIFLPK